MTSQPALLIFSQDDQLVNVNCWKKCAIPVSYNVIGSRNIRVQKKMLENIYIGHLMIIQSFLSFLFFVILLNWSSYTPNCHKASGWGNVETTHNPVCAVYNLRFGRVCSAPACDSVSVWLAQVRITGWEILQQSLL